MREVAEAEFCMFWGLTAYELIRGISGTIWRCGSFEFWSLGASWAPLATSFYIVSIEILSRKPL